MSYRPKHAPCRCGCGEMRDECPRGGNPLAAFTVTTPDLNPYQPRREYRCAGPDDCRAVLTAPGLCRTCQGLADDATRDAQKEVS